MLARRLIALALLGLALLLCIQPIRAYRDGQARLDAARADLLDARAHASALIRERRAATTQAWVEREARALGYVKRGETPFVVAGSAGR